MSVRPAKTAVIFPLFIIMLLAAGCGGMSTPPEVDPNALRNELTGKVWICESIFNQEIQEQAGVTIEFLEDGTVKGSGGCNTYSGPFTLSKDSIKIGPLNTTEKMCGAVTGEREFTYFTYLPRINRVSIEDGELRLYTNDAVAPILFTEKDGESSLW